MTYNYFDERKLITNVPNRKRWENENYMDIVLHTSFKEFLSYINSIQKLDKTIGDRKLTT